MATDTTTGFDTLACARRIKEAGVSDAQAEAHAEAVRDAVTCGAAAKTDLAELRADIYRALWIQGAGIVAIIVGLKLFG